MQAATGLQAPDGDIRLRASERLVSFSTRLQLRKERRAATPPVADRPPQRAADVVAEQARGDPRGRDRPVRPRGLRALEVGRRGGCRRHRLDGAVSLLRVQAPLPLRDHGRGARGRSREVRADHRRARRLRRGADRRCSTAPSTSPSTRCCATACSSPSRSSSACTGRPRARRRRASSRARGRAISSSRGRRSSRAGWSRARSPRPTRACSTRAILGLYNSVFHWYRPRGGLALSEVGDFYVRRCLAVAGLPMDRARAGQAEAATASR